MTPEEKIKICTLCQNSKRSLKKGIVCGLTDEKPQFEVTCESFLIDKEKVEREKRHQEDKEYDMFEEPDDPKTKRWGNLVISFLASFTLFFIIGFCKSKDEGQSSAMTLRDQLEYSIAKLNKMLPMAMEGGVMTHISLEGHNIIYDFNYDVEVDLSEEDKGIMAMVHKHCGMSNMNSLQNFDAIELYEIIKGTEYSLLYRCHDVSSKYLFSFTINEDELRKAVSSAKYKCPLKDIRTAVDYVNKDLPFEDVDGFVFGKAVFNEDPYELIYSITFPYTKVEMEFILKEDLDDYAVELCNEIWDPAMILAGINEYPVVFVFHSADGTEYHRYAHKIIL